MTIELKYKNKIIQQITEVILPVNYHKNFDRKSDTTSDTGTFYEAENKDLTSSSVLIPLIWRRNNWKLVMTKRSIQLKKHSGQISFPGGKYDLKDETLYNTALRETFEEIGVNFRDIGIFGSLQSHETITGFRIFPFIGIVSPNKNLVKNSEEVEEIFEVPLKFVLNKSRFSRHYLKIKNEKREYLAIPYGSYYIWGATARILYNLSEKFNEKWGTKFEDS